MSVTRVKLLPESNQVRHLVNNRFYLYTYTHTLMPARKVTHSLIDTDIHIHPLPTNSLTHGIIFDILYFQVEL